MSCGMDMQPDKALRESKMGQKGSKMAQDIPKMSRKRPQRTTDASCNQLTTKIGYLAAIFEPSVAYDLSPAMHGTCMEPLGAERVGWHASGMLCPPFAEAFLESTCSKNWQSCGQPLKGPQAPHNKKNRHTKISKTAPL